MTLRHLIRLAGIVFMVGALVLMGCAQQTQTPAPASEAPKAGAPKAEAPKSAPPKPAMETAISLASHPTGTSYHAAGVGIAKVISEHSPLAVSVTPFDGPTAYIPRMDRGEADLGLPAVGDAAWAFTGSTGFPKANKNVRLLVQGTWQMLPGLVVRKDSGITQIRELKGKRVASDFAGNTFAVQVERAMLASVGMSLDDTRKVPVTSVVDAANALRDNRLDAAIIGAATVPSGLEVHNAIGLRALNLADAARVEDVSAEAAKTLASILPSAVPKLLKGGVGFVEQPTVVISYPIVLIAGAHLSEDAGYNVIKSMWENYEGYVKVHAFASGFIPDNMFTDNPSVPYHPGAVRFFKEKGLWNDKVQQRQTELMAQAR